MCDERKEPEDDIAEQVAIEYSYEKKEGGPAFPCKNTAYLEHCSGMTLRDWFAGQYLAGMITLMAGGGGGGGNIYIGVGSAGPDSANDDQGNRVVRTSDKEKLVEEAYEVADAMIEARKLEP